MLMIRADRAFDGERFLSGPATVVLQDGTIAGVEPGRPDPAQVADVLDLGDGTSVVVYAADAQPATMALVIAGAAGNALEHLRSILEGTA